MNRRKRQILQTAALLLAGGGVLVAGCRQAGVVRTATHPAEVHLPQWFTAPQADEQRDVPVSLGVQLPPHLSPLAREFRLPNWVIYGVVRSLGADEFLANGIFRSFSVVDERGSSRVVIDDVYYDVPMDQVRRVLSGIATECGAAETERERLDVLGSFVQRRYGGMVLFSLRRGNDGPNLLLSSGRSTDPAETFARGRTPEPMPVVGWRETGGRTITTMIGTFHYGNAELSFRRTEEEAIRDLAKGLMFKFSHMSKQFIEGGDKVSEDMKEEVYREEITLRMRGVRVRRRVVDMERGLCVVEVCVPVDGVARQ